MKIGIITVLYNSEKVITAFIESLNKQSDHSFEVLFIENEIENPNCERLIKSRAHFSFQFIRNNDNVGVAKANNQGIEWFLNDSTVTHLLFLNNDVEFDVDFLSSQCALYKKYPYVQALAPKIYYFNSNNKIWYAGGALSYLKGGCTHFGHNKSDRLKGRELYQVTYAPTCSLMIPVNVLASTGIRMWEELFVYYDDTVFCWELNRAGISIHYTPAVRLEHKISNSTGGSGSNFSRYYMTRNWAYVGRQTGNICVKAVTPFLYLWFKFCRRDIEVSAIIDSRYMQRCKA